MQAVTPVDWDDIWRLTERYYATDREYAERTLKTHQCLVLFRTRGDRELVGMAAVDVYPSEYAGRRIAVIFTSHVLLDDRFRGQNLIQRLGFRTFLAARRRFPLRPVYWFFDTFSYKSYLLLPRNFQDYWPRFDRPMPSRERRLMNHLAAEAYGVHGVPSRASWRVPAASGCGPKPRRSSPGCSIGPRSRSSFESIPAMPRATCSCACVR